ncbi:MAG: sigma-70 family RNA polymerase sigma factor [Clostridia bacterium]|nr:sigma-70 family RNA polymerase sigma factor [Clostridia bacterium]
MNDYEIIALYGARDEAAIRETAAKYGGYCFSIANNILANEQDSEECVNDTYLRTWNCIPPQNPNNFKMFLAKITRNLALDRYRAQTCVKRGGGEVVTALDEIAELVADTTEVDGEVAEREFANMLNAFLHSLPERECNIFVRRYFYMDEIENIARKYRLRESNVLVILSRTRKKLRENLRKKGYMI